MFLQLGRGVVRHPWWFITVWAIAAVAIIGLAPKLTTTSSEINFLPSHYQSVQAQKLQQKDFPTAAAPAAIVVFERQGGGRLTAATSRDIVSIASRLRADRIPTMGAMQASAPSPNHLVQIIGVQMANAQGNLTTAQTNAVGTLRADLVSLTKGTGLLAGVTGTAAQYVDQQASGRSALAIVGIVTILLIIGLLLLIFRSPVIAFLPIVVIGVIYQMAQGLIAALSKAAGLNIDSTVATMLIVVLFGVGTDYTLFLMFRYRERLRAGEDAKAAMTSAIARVGPAIATAAGAVIIAFLALTLSSLSLFRSLGPALAISVACLLLAGLTLVPAIVSLLGTRVFWPSAAWKAERPDERFRTLATALGRRPGRFALVSGGVLVVLAIFSFGFRPSFNLSSGSTSSSQSAIFGQVLLKGLPAGSTNPTYVFLRSTDGSPLSQSEVTSYAQRLRAANGVSTVAQPKLGAGGSVADYEVVLKAPGESNAAMAIVSGPLQRAANHAPAGTRPLIGGMTSVLVDLHSAMNHDYAIVFPVAAALILVILAILLQSLVAPWYLMGAVGLGFAATLGASVLVFQDAASQSGLTFILPIIMYLFVVALGTDYNILMISRLREEAREGLNSHDAAAMAVRHAGPTIASAGLILAGTFASLMLGGGTTLVSMGFAISFGIAVAAFVMAMFLTPSLTALIGHAVWWPGHDRNEHGPQGHESAALVPGSLSHLNGGDSIDHNGTRTGAPSGATPIRGRREVR